MHINERGRVCPCTLVDRKRKRLLNAVDVLGANGVAAGGGTGAVAAGADAVALESLTGTAADLCPLGTRSNASVVALPFFSSASS